MLKINEDDDTLGQLTDYAASKHSFHSNSSNEEEDDISGKQFQTMKSGDFNYQQMQEKIDKIEVQSEVIVEMKQGLEEIGDKMKETRRSLKIGRKKLYMHQIKTKIMSLSQKLDEADIFDVKKEIGLRFIFLRVNDT